MNVAQDTQRGPLITSYRIYLRAAIWDSTRRSIRYLILRPVQPEFQGLKM